MAASDDSTVTTTYMVVDGDGRALTTGLQGPEVCDEAAQTAQRLADRYGHAVWLVPAAADEIEDEGERYDPAVEIEAHVATETHTGVEGGVDVTVTVTIGEVELDGEVTLVRDHEGRWSSWGDVSHWVEERLLRQLTDRLAGASRQLDRVLGEIEAKASAVAREAQG